MVETHAADRWSTPPRVHRLWAGVLLAPFAWVVHLSVSYALATLACTAAGTALLYVTAAATLALAGAGAWTAARNRRVVRQVEDDAASAARAEFMAVSGLLLSLLFAAAIVAQTIPALFLQPCQ